MEQWDIPQLERHINEAAVQLSKTFEETGSFGSIQTQKPEATDASSFTITPRKTRKGPLRSPIANTTARNTHKRDTPSIISVKFSSAALYRFEGLPSAFSKACYLTSNARTHPKVPESPISKDAQDDTLAPACVGLDDLFYQRPESKQHRRGMLRTFVS